MFLIMMFQSACVNEPIGNCCPIVTGRIENPKKVREYVVNDEIFKEYIKRCNCN